MQVGGRDVQEREPLLEGTRYRMYFWKGVFILLVVICIIGFGFTLANFLLLKHAVKTQNPPVTDRFFTFNLFYDGSDTNYIEKGQVVSFCDGSEVCRGLGARSKGHSSWIQFSKAPKCSKVVYMNYRYLYLYVDPETSHLRSKMWRTNGQRVSVENTRDILIDTNATKILDTKALNDTHFVVLYTKHDPATTTFLSPFASPPPSLFIILGYIDPRNNYDLHFYPPFLIQDNALSNSTAVILERIYIAFSYYEVDNTRPPTMSLVLLKVTSSEAGFTVVYRAPQRDIAVDESSAVTLCKAADDKQFVIVQKNAAYLYSLVENEKLENVHSVSFTAPSSLYKVSCENGNVVVLTHSPHNRTFAFVISVNDDRSHLTKSPKIFIPYKISFNTLTSCSAFSYETDIAMRFNTSGSFWQFWDKRGNLKTFRTQLTESGRYTYPAFSSLLSLHSPLPNNSSVKDRTCKWSELVCDGPYAQFFMVVSVANKEGQTLTYGSIFEWFGGLRIAGVAQESASEGQEVRLTLGGISSAHRDLVPGYKYYANYEGDLTLQVNTNQLPFVGTALSDTQLLMNPELLPGEREHQREYDDSSFEFAENLYQ